MKSPKGNSDKFKKCIQLTKSCKLIETSDTTFVIPQQAKIEQKNPDVRQNNITVIMERIRNRTK